MYYLLQKSKSQVKRVMVLFLSLSQDRMFLLKIGSMLFDKNIFSKCNKTKLIFLLWSFLFSESESEYIHFDKKVFFAVKRDFQFTDSKMFKPGMIIIIIQTVLLNINTTEFLSEADLKQTCWKIFNLVLNVQVILIPSVSLITY